MNTLRPRPQAFTVPPAAGIADNPHATIQDLYKASGRQVASPHAYSYRSVFVSDLHLGSSISLAKEFLEFLKAMSAEYFLYVGDMVEQTRLSELWKDPVTSEIGREILRKDAAGIKQVFFDGNHDPFFVKFAGQIFNNILILKAGIFETLGGLRIFVDHGDDADDCVRDHPLKTVLVTRLFEQAAGLSLKIGLGQSLLHAIKTSFDRVTDSFLENRARTVWSINARIAEHNRQHPGAPIPLIGASLNGHTHNAGIRLVPMPGHPETGAAIGPAILPLYDTGTWSGKTVRANAANSGSRPPCCTFIVEHFDGRLEHQQWQPGHGIVPLNLEPRSLQPPAPRPPSLGRLRHFVTAACG